MRPEVGVWIDHRHAVIATIEGADVDLQQVASNMEQRVRYSAAHPGSAENQRDRQFAEHLRRYYDEVIARIKDAGSILILGPGAAKIELEARLDREALGGRIVGVQTTDKMSDEQIAARVRERFAKTDGDPGSGAA